MKLLGGTVWCDEKAVYRGGDRLDGLDPARTKVYYRNWACDGSAVFYMHGRVRKLDAEKFVALNQLYAHDETRCCCAHKAIPGADAASFRPLDSGCEKISDECQNFEDGYAADSSRVYFSGNVLKHADPTTFRSLGMCFGRDKASVFYERFRLSVKDLIAWRRLGTLYSTDGRSVFYMHKKVVGADASTFRLLRGDSHFAFDRQRYFVAGRQAASDEIVEGLRREAESKSKLARMIEDGKWFDLRRSEFKAYDSPASIHGDQ